MSGIQTCLGVCDKNMGKGHFGRGLGGGSGRGHLGRQQLPRLAPGKEKPRAQAAAAVFKAGRAIESMILMAEKRMVTESRKGDDVSASVLTLGPCRLKC